VASVANSGNIAERRKTRAVMMISAFEASPDWL
jgi:hypothetical protein